LSAPARPRVIYISYDGAVEALGQSQIVAYLERLAQTCDIDLISFEKPGDDRGSVETTLAAASVRWHPLSYHRRPPALSTAYDVTLGTRLVRRLAARMDAAVILHARSYVPALMALRAGLGEHARFLFDIRGFWADERVDTGTWRRGGMLYRLAKRHERRFFAEADAVVTLTEASVRQIRAWMDSNDAPVEVIPTCVDLDRFRPIPPGERGPRVIWAGTVGPRYDFRAGVAVARELGLPLTVLTREVDDARAALDGPIDVSFRSVPSTEIPGEFAAGDVGLATMLPTFSKLASAPTRVGEYLAAGMPVASLAGVGDLDRLLPEARVGVVLPDSGPDSVRAAATELSALLRDPETPARCRRLAEERFSLTDGVARYLELYKRLSGPGA
jgi:glycosyltransferase involved in cell wall biosynthesis